MLKALFFLILFSVIYGSTIYEFTDNDFEEKVFESEDPWIIYFYTSKYYFFFL